MLAKIMAKQKAKNNSYYGQISKITGHPKTLHVKGYYRTSFNVTTKQIRRKTVEIVQNVFPTIHIM